MLTVVGFEGTEGGKGRGVRLGTGAQGPGRETLREGHRGVDRNLRRQ